MKMEKIKILKTKNQVRLLFNSSFYKTEFIDAAVKDFEKICRIHRLDNILFIEPNEGLDVETIGYEFYNYVLCLSKNS